jgi:hypothetical protein
MSGGSSSGSGFDDWRSPNGGGKAGGSGGGRTGGGSDKCAIYETAILASPVATVVATLNVDDKLTVGLETSPRNRVVVRTKDGKVAGAITSVQLVNMIECMQSGYAYEAKVKSINGGRVEVEISPA